MNKKELLRRVGIKPHLAYSTKGEKLEYIKSLDKDFGIAFKKYFEESNDLINRLFEIHSELKEKGNGCVFAFSRLLKSKGVHQHENSFFTSISSTRAFYDERIMSFKKFNRVKKIIEIYEDFKKHNCN